MRTIALIHPKINFEDNYPCSWLPFSVLSVGSNLDLSKFKVRIFDEHLTSANEIRSSLADDDLLIAGISIMTGGGQIRNALNIAQLLREAHPYAAIVFGGPHASVMPEQTASCDLVDYVISGPAQYSFAMLSEALDEGLNPDGIPGLYFRRKGKVILPKKRKALLTSLPPYKFELIDAEAYIKYDATISDRVLNYTASQGCPYGCRFCYENVYDRKYYKMSSDRTAEDIKTYAEKFNVDGIKFYDADFFIDITGSSRIIKQLGNYNLAWAASIHPNHILRFQNSSGNHLLREMSENGCTRLLIGMESGSNRVLSNIINKRTRADDYLKIAKVVAEYGIIGSYTFMVGFPDEKEEEYEETFSLVRSLWNLRVPLETKIHIYLPYPGTPLFDEALNMGFVPPQSLEEWSDFNYYEAMTPWTSSELEKKLSFYTHMINKKKV